MNYEQLSKEDLKAVALAFHNIWLNEFEAGKHFLQIDFRELESYFKQQSCIACRAIYLHKMNAIIGLIEEVLSLQSEKHKNEHH